MKQGDLYRDSDGRVFKLLQRVDPVGPTPAYWRAATLNSGRESTIREDRLQAEYDEASGIE